MGFGLIVRRFGEGEHPLPRLREVHEGMTFARCVSEDACPHIGLTHLGDPLIQRQIRDFLVARIQHEGIGGQFQSDHQADRPGEDLCGDLGARGVVLLDQIHRAGPDRIAGIPGRQGEGDRHAGIGGSLEHLVQHALIAARRDIRDELQQAAATVGHTGHDRRDLVVGRVIGGNGRTAAGLVEGEPRR